MVSHQLKVDSTNLDPDLITELQATAAEFDEQQYKADRAKWEIAAKVNEMWDEHLTQFAGSKVDYYGECSRICNIGLRRKRFSDSGETLRRWCEVQETYAEFEHAERFLEILSFEHLRVAKKLCKDEKVNVPVVALALAVREKWTAEEMRQHYDPSQAVHPYDAMKAKLAILLDKGSYPFLKSRADIDYCVTRAREINDRINLVLEKEGKAHD